MITRCFILSLSLVLVSPTVKADAGAWVKEWVVGAELGAGLSTLVSDLATGLMAGGLGRQLSLSASTRQSQDLGLKVRFDRTWLKEWTIGTVKFAEYGATNRIESMERGYSILSVGLEGRRNEDHAYWVWETTLGFAFTDGGEIGLQSTDPTISQIQTQSRSARSQIVLGGSYGYRRKWGEKWFFTSSLRTFILAPPLFDGPMGDRAIYGLPVLFSFALERQLF